MRTAFLTGRLVVAGFYLFSGANLLLHSAKTAVYAAAKGVPFPEVAVPVAGAFLLVGGLSLLFGWKPSVEIGAIVLFLAPVTIYMHPFWSETGAAQMNDMVNFTKNIALLGSALMLSAIPRPWVASVDASLEHGEQPPVEMAPRREQRSARG